MLKQYTVGNKNPERQLHVKSSFLTHVRLKYRTNMA